MSVLGALVAGLLLLGRTVLLQKSYTNPAQLPKSPLYAEKILRELDTKTHQAFQVDEDYNQAIFQRYKDFLHEDMKVLASVGGGATLFWCALFRIWYVILTTKSGFKAFGQQSEGLRILMSAMLLALKAAGPDRLGRVV